MKVIHLTDTLPGAHKKWGGAERVAEKTIDLAAKFGAENMVFCLKPDIWNKNYPFFVLRTMEERFGWRVASAIRSILPFDFLAYFETLKLLKKIKPDVVHLHNVSEISLAPILAAKRLKIKVALAVYDYWYFCPKRILIKKDGALCRDFHGIACQGCFEPKRLPRIENLFLPLRRKIFDYFLNKIDKFLTLSEASKNLLADYGISKDRIVVIPAPITPVFEKAISGDSKKIIFAAWLSPHKGLHIILEAMPEVLQSAPDAKLIVSANGGDAGYKQGIENLIKSLGMENNVLILAKKDADIGELIKEAALVVIPEQWENMSPVLMLEGALAGMPMVLSRVGGIPEFISDERFLAEHNNPTDWAKKILWIFQNQDEARRIMQEEIKPKVEKMLDADHLKGSIKNLYESK